MSRVSKTVLDITNITKPILLKIFPRDFLRKMKGKFIKNSLGEFENLNILSYEAGHYKQGINLIGNIEAGSGLGQSCRLIARVLDEAHVPFEIYKYTELGEQKAVDTTWSDKITNRLPYDINLIHINPHELGIAYLQMNREVWNYRYNIGFWLWELEDFPDEWIPCFNCVDEIWAPSEFVCNAIRKKTNLPVKCIPYHVEIKIDKEWTRKDFHLPEDKFLFLMMYDHRSCMERKNPIAVINAFKKAFSKQNPNVGLVIKINNSCQEDEEAISSILDGYTNVYLIKESLTRDAVNSLTKCVDVVVSLHRAEGFGLVMAEAMLLGTPTIATNWSSNTEFMNHEVACMVDYKLVTLKEDIPPFKRGSRWADPDVDQATKYMKKLFEDKIYYNNIAEKAKKHAEYVLGLERATSIMKKRISEIYERLEGKEN